MSASIPATAFSVIAGGSAIAAIGLSQLVAVGALSVMPAGPQALASGVVAAFITAALGGLCVALVARVPGEVSGPRTSISVIYTALCADLIARSHGAGLAEVLAELSLAVVLMGLLQILAGWTRLGEVMKFLPYPVNAGFVTGIGLLVVWSQVGPLLGLEHRFASYDWEGLVENVKPLALLLGIAAAVTVWLTPRFAPRVQPLLAGLFVGTALYHGVAFFWGAEALGPTLGAIEPLAAAEANLDAVWSRLNWKWLADATLHVLPYSGFLALQGIMNTALAAVAVGEMTGARPNVNRALFAQGCANVLCGLLGALPIAPSPSQSMVAAKMGPISSIVPAASCIILLVGALAFGSALQHVPVVVLAGLLVTAGTGLVDRWARDLVGRIARGRDAQREVWWNLATVAAVAGAFFFGSVPVALLVGTVLATIMLAAGLSTATRFLSQEGTRVASTRVWPPEQTQWLAGARAAIHVLRPRGGLFFGTAEQLAAHTATLGGQVRYCVIDCSLLTMLDATGCRIVAGSARKLAARGITTILAGLRTRGGALIALGLNFPPPATHWFQDLDHALEHVEAELLKTQWPDVAADAPVDITRSQLASGLSPEELAALQSHLVAADLEAGTVLFKSGAAGSAMYLIDRGLVEIRISTEIAGRARRMAVLGPGCIFGEIAMLTNGYRTADAVCVRATRLYELKGESFEALGQAFPRAYARILANINFNLATRLVAATEVARAQ